jgi:hypothetical protein
MTLISKDLIKILSKGKDITDINTGIVIPEDFIAALFL